MNRRFEAVRAGERCQSDIEQTFRSSSGKAIAILIRTLGDIHLAEEAVQDSFVKAVERWPRDGVPLEPEGWIVTTARNGAIDRVRREASRDSRQLESHRMLANDGPSDDTGPVRDDQLRLLFTCCHPALSPDARVALTLRLVAGLDTAAIARAFLVQESTMAQRLVRARRKIRNARIPYRVPSEVDLPARLRSVLAVVYLVANEGHLAARGDALDRADLGSEAIRLARLLAELLPDEGDVLGLLALLLLTESRRPARTDLEGHVVRLADQDRTRWDRALIAEGQEIVRRCLRQNMPGPYQVQAAIAAVHADARRFEDTDWTQIVTLYDHLLALASTPVVALNRAVAIAERDGPATALDLLDPLAAPLHDYHLWYATRGDLLARLGRNAEATASLEQALALTHNETERTFLANRLANLRPRRSSLDAP